MRFFLFPSSLLPALICLNFALFFQFLFQLKFRQLRQPAKHQLFFSFFFDILYSNVLFLLFSHLFCDSMFVFLPCVIYSKCVCMCIFVFVYACKTINQRCKIFTFIFLLLLLLLLLFQQFD